MRLLFLGLRAPIVLGLIWECNPVRDYAFGKGNWIDAVGHSAGLEL